MKTVFRAPAQYADILLRCAQSYTPASPALPHRFCEMMRHNRGCISMLSGDVKDPEGLEWKNPVVVALGDSVTAGHFESLLPNDPEEVQRMMQEGMAAAAAGQPLPPVEITDARECYLERFRVKLIDYYEQTSVSVLNAGIAGDTLRGMSDRLERDVLRYKSDLVIINGSLNWDDALGTTEEYKALLRDVVQRVKDQTEADIVLLTPNGDLPNTMFGAPPPHRTHERVAAIRAVAQEQQVCLCDVYSIWEEAREMGCPWESVLANGINHPGMEGHEVYAISLMKLILRAETC